MMIFPRKRLCSESQIQVLHRHDDLPQEEALLGIALCNFLRLNGKLLTQRFRRFEFGLERSGLGRETKNFVRALLLIVLELLPDLLVARLEERLVPDQVPVRCFEGFVPREEILDLGEVRRILLCALQELLVLHVPLHLVLEVDALALELLQLYLELSDLFILLLDLHLLVRTPRLRPPPLRLVILQELVEADELVLQVQVFRAQALLSLLELLLIFRKASLLRF